MVYVSQVGCMITLQPPTLWGASLLTRELRRPGTSETHQIQIYVGPQWPLSEVGCTEQRSLRRSRKELNFGDVSSDQTAPSVDCVSGCCLNMMMNIHLT